MDDGSTCIDDFSYSLQYTFPDNERDTRQRAPRSKILEGGVALTEQL